MSKQHVRRGRYGKWARQQRAENPNQDVTRPIQKWDDEKKVWVKL